MLRRAKQLFSALFRSGSRTRRILQGFDQQRQELQNEFFALASATGKPRGLRWKNCVWLDTFTLVQDPKTGMFTMFCGVNVSFEAIEGGDMEGVEAVSMIRDGSAVFHHQRNRWGSGGRVLFNMNPATAASTLTSGQTLIRSSDDVNGG